MSYRAALAVLLLASTTSPAQVPAPLAQGRPTGQAPDVVMVDADLAYPPGKPEVLGRDQWLRADTTCKHLSPRAVNEDDVDDDDQPRTRIAVHHTQGFVSDEELALGEAASAARVKELLCGIREYHMGVISKRIVVVRKKRGKKRRQTVIHRDGHDWADIGYHFLIDWRGRVWEGRKLEKVGANVRSNNNGLIGVALLGDFMQQKPTPEQQRSLKQLLGWLVAAYKIAPNGIKGHGDIVQTDCPGRLMKEPLDKLREELQPLWARVPHTADDEIDEPVPVRTAELELPMAARALDGAGVSFDGRP